MISKVGTNRGILVVQSVIYKSRFLTDKTPSQLEEIDRALRYGAFKKFINLKDIQGISIDAYVEDEAPCVVVECMESDTNRHDLEAIASDTMKAIWKLERKHYDTTNYKKDRWRLNRGILVALYKEDGKPISCSIEGTFYKPKQGCHGLRPIEDYKEAVKNYHERTSKKSELYRNDIVERKFTVFDDYRFRVDTQINDFDAFIEYYKKIYPNANFSDRFIDRISTYPAFTTYINLVYLRP